MYENVSKFGYFFETQKQRNLKYTTACVKLLSPKKTGPVKYTIFLKKLFNIFLLKSIFPFANFFYVLTWLEYCRVYGLFGVVTWDCTFFLSLSCKAMLRVRENRKTR